MSKGLSRLLRYVNRRTELIFWIGSLIWLWFLPGSEGHFTLCPIGAMGFDWCPGCGLGHALHELMHGHFAEALRHHYLVLFAAAVIVYRIFSLTISNHKFNLHYDRG